jgi:hypothetical protein
MQVHQEWEVSIAIRGAVREEAQDDEEIEGPIRVGIDEYSFI